MHADTMRLESTSTPVVSRSNTPILGPHMVTR
jgi:hypothetical protein